MTDALVEDRAAVPLRIEDGRLVTEAVEVNAAWHCNISCQWCSHASPIAPQRFADPSRVASDLSELAKSMRVDHIRVLGGEPLLHPRLTDMLSAAKQSGLGSRLRVLTNGLTLHKMGSTFWHTVDEVHVSVYPSTTAAVERRQEELARSAADSNTTLILKYFDHFRVSYREPSADHDLTGRIYKTCQVANLWRCLTVDDGRLYRCPQAAHVHMDDQYEAHRSTHGDDYLEIGRIISAGEILAWLRRPVALSSCQVCTGSVGTLKPHQQIIRSRRPESGPLVDRGYLDILEKDSTASNACVGRDVVLWEKK